jgi:glycosyltransferase involved in cell wall biosynthesis
VAQERKKRRIVIASILKPVDDTRMTEKMGITCHRAGYDVTVIGYPTTSIKSNAGIRLVSLPSFSRLSLGRIKAKWTVMSKAWQQRPDVFIFTTHELIGPALMLKIFANTKVVYDVRENYYRNILLGGSFAWIIRWPLAAMVRFKEKLLAPMIDHFFLAERAYEQEFRFHRGGWTVIENKAVAVTALPRQRNGRRLLFSGTLSTTTGVFDAIDLALQLHQVDPRITLTIVGYAAAPKVQEQLVALGREHSFITLVGIHHLVPHEVIEQFIRDSDLGILSYPQARHTQGSRPTKLYEYLAAALPMVVADYWPWINEFGYCHPFIVTRFSKPDIAEVLRQWDTANFYAQPARDVGWAGEETKLLKALIALETK